MLRDGLVPLPPVQCRHFKLNRLLSRTLAVVCLMLAARAMVAQQMTVLFGTHVAGAGKGFSASSFDAKTGELGTPKLVAEADAPATFVLVDGNKRLYTCNSTGFVSAYSVAERGRKLTLLNKVPSEGGDPNAISLDVTGKYLFVANYAGASIIAWTLRPDGSIGARTAFVQYTGSGADPGRQKLAYAHSIIADPTNHFVLSGNLGLDKLFVYRFNARDGSLVPNDPAYATVAPGTGARLVLFHPNGRWVYLNTEMGSSIVVYHWESATGRLTEQQVVSTLAPDFHGSSNASDIRISADGRFLYATNRVNGGGDGEIAVFAIDAKSGRLTPIQHVSSGGRIPRNFEIDPTGEWMIVANQESNNAQVFRIDRNSGMLTPVGAPVSVPYPFSPRFVVASK